MNLERLSYFVAVARHMNFTRAAEECKIAQTAMSRQISMLEDEIGFALFVRSNRTIGFTPAGKVFYEGVLSVLRLYEETLEKSKDVLRGLNGSLHIGIGVYEHAFVAPLVEEFHRLYPSIEVRISQYDYKRLSEQFSSRKLDVIFALPVSAEYFAEEPVNTQQLFESRTCIALRRDHPLAGGEVFPSEGWNTESFISVSQEGGPCTLSRFHQKLQAVNLAVGRKPICVTNLNEGLLMVEAGMGVMALPDFMESHLPPKLTMLPFKERIGGQFVAISHKDTKNPAVSVFVKGIYSSDTLKKWQEQEK